ncbi:MAG: hypothetical protein NWQ54_20870 [Paraglaciecola sp.]|nr:hypothetical protein [Paraglaciecola sp.]
MFKRWRNVFPEDSIFRIPLVCEISVVVVLKIILLIVLWHVAFKPLKPTEAPDMTTQLISKPTSITHTKETQHD